MRPERALRAHRRTSLCLALAVAIELAACGGGPGSSEDDVSPASGEVAVRVISHYWSDVTISIARGGGTWNRLGLAGANKATSFMVPVSQLGSSSSTRLLADPIGGDRALVSDQVSVHSGAIIVWTLESTLDRSTVAVY